MIATISTAVYATVTTLGHIKGGNVNVVDFVAEITYSTENNALVEWTPELEVGMGYEWYCRLEIDAGGYVGDVDIYFNRGMWVENPPTLDYGMWSSKNLVKLEGFYLTGEEQIIYASSDGSITGNENIDNHILRAGTYRVVTNIRKVVA